MLGVKTAAEIRKGPNKVSDLFIIITNFHNTTVMEG